MDKPNYRDHVIQTGSGGKSPAVKARFTIGKYDALDKYCEVVAEDVEGVFQTEDEAHQAAVAAARKRVDALIST
jgi:hypothetical protein